MKKKELVKLILKIFPNCFTYRDYIYGQYYKKIKKENDISFSEIVSEYLNISLNNKNVFFGYYDLSQFKDGKYLVHVCDKDADPSKDDCEVGYFDNCGKYFKLDKTDTWCWQQGSRLRWSKIYKNCIYYNKGINNKYCTVLFDIEKKIKIKQINYPLYDISNDESFGFSINYTRLQKIRPGYGYERVDNDKLDVDAPQNDGLFFINITNNSSELVVSLSTLAKQVNIEGYIHYLNHVSISPDDKSVMFFHIMKNKKNNEVINRLMIYNIENKTLKCLEENDKTSHYTWKDNKHLLLTQISSKDNSCYYSIINIYNNKKLIYDRTFLNEDGHPNYINSGIFVTDTYRKAKTNKQELFIYNEKQNKKKTIGSFYHSPLVKEEKRCDLHPRVFNEIISIDTIFGDGLRKCVIFKLNKEILKLWK